MDMYCSWHCWCFYLRTPDSVTREGTRNIRQSHQISLTLMCTFKKVWGIDTIEKSTSFNKWIPSNKAAKFSLRLSFSLKKSCYKEVKRSTEVPAANFMKQKIVLCVTCSHFLSIYMQRSIATMQRKFWNISWFEQQKFQYFNLWPHKLLTSQQ